MKGNRKWLVIGAALLGAAIGFMVGGPVGAALGAGLGLLLGGAGRELLSAATRPEQPAETSVSTREPGSAPEMTPQDEHARPRTLDPESLQRSDSRRSSLEQFEPAREMTRPESAQSGRDSPEARGVEQDWPFRLTRPTSPTPSIAAVSSESTVQRPPFKQEMVGLRPAGDPGNGRGSAAYVRPDHQNRTASPRPPGRAK
ncbi:hypothetical protein ABZ119_17235 [Streptomyces sp. NPDC006288]|uniref:hypothetical protein n=1 Tax=Streptomyces sp. NPDC006288 TaxID=3156743 RepID=UPI0033A26E25